MCATVANTKEGLLSNYYHQVIESGKTQAALSAGVSRLQEEGKKGT